MNTCCFCFRFSCYLGGVILFVISVWRRLLLRIASSLLSLAPSLFVSEMDALSIHSTSEDHALPVQLALHLQT